jgi:hypothetical protein
MQKTPCSIVIDLCYSPSLDGKRRQRGIAAPFGVPQGSTDQRAAIREGMTARLPLTCQGSTHQLAANREGMANRRAPTPRRTSPSLPRQSHKNARSPMFRRAKAMRWRMTYAVPTWRESVRG